MGQTRLLVEYEQRTRLLNGSTVLTRIWLEYGSNPFSLDSWPVNKWVSRVKLLGCTSFNIETQFNHTFIFGSWFQLHICFEPFFWSCHFSYFGHGSFSDWNSACTWKLFSFHHHSLFFNSEDCNMRLAMSVWVMAYLSSKFQVLQ